MRTIATREDGHDDDLVAGHVEPGWARPLWYPDVLLTTD